MLLAESGLGLRQVAGPREGERPVYAVHTSEMEDPVPYLLGGEMLLSAGVHCPHAEGPGGYWERYVARTVEAGAAALGFGIAPVHDAVPRALVEACERYGLPLVEVPRETTFTAVARAMWQASAERRHRELRRLSEGQQALAGAAARPHPVPAVLRQLAQHLGGWVVLLSADGTELSAAGERPGADARGALAALAARLPAGGGPVSAADTLPAGAGESHLSVYALPGPAPGSGRMALGVCAGRREAADAAIAGGAVVLLSLLTSSRTGAADVRHAAGLVRLMLGAEPASVAPLLAAPSGQVAADDGELWTVVHGRRRGRTGTGHAPFAVAEAAAGLGTSLVDVEGDRLRALVPGSGEVRALAGWTLGAGAPVSAGELARGDAEAARALGRAVAERAPVVRQREGAGGVTGLVPADEARALARTRLAPLEGAPAVVETLRTWLSLHGSWDRTAVALGVHRNTVRQRIGRAAELLDADLGDADVRMELWFALKWG
ncbi:PucR family transcriptional regulator [Streptomyces pathocidini]|uniref:PucR family transcriptional regulator n=1 Tax=Streptomyces pathocidini TaxID=1650571 RepID=UPI003400DB36